MIFFPFFLFYAAINEIGQPGPASSDDEEEGWWCTFSRVQTKLSYSALQVLQRLRVEPYKKATTTGIEFAALSAPV